jgi:hypothetical protein
MISAFDLLDGRPLATITERWAVSSPVFQTGDETARRATRTRPSGLRFVLFSDNGVSPRTENSSQRRKQAARELATCHQTIRRQRLDFQFKMANQLLQQNNIIYHEQSQVRNMIRNHHVAESISDAGWS